MKQIIPLLLLLFVVFAGCKTDKKTTVEEEKPELTVLQKIAKANGYDNWQGISTLKFTFNVDRDTTHFERNWHWNIAANEVTGISFQDTVTYNRAEVDSTSAKVDAAFINDKYWMLAPYQLLWDQESFTYTLDSIAEAPISKKPMQKLTIVYGNEGGYTPGDAYDFFFGDDYLIQEWIFRRSNQPEPSLITTWENYQELEGLKIATVHKNEEGNFQISFTGLKAVRE